MSNPGGQQQYQAGDGAGITNNFDYMYQLNQEVNHSSSTANTSSKKKQSVPQSGISKQQELQLFERTSIFNKAMGQAEKKANKLIRDIYRIIPEDQDIGDGP